MNVEKFLRKADAVIDRHLSTTIKGLITSIIFFSAVLPLLISFYSLIIIGSLFILTLSIVLRKKNLIRKRHLNASIPEEEMRREAKLEESAD